MKIEKFGTVTEENGTLILDGFVVNGENVEYPSYEAAGVAIVSAFKEMVAQIDVRSPFFPKNYLSIHSEPAAPPVAAGSVDSPAFRNMLATWSGHNEDWRIRHASESMDGIVAHVNAWGAHQRMEGKREGEDTVAMAERMKLFFSVHDKAFIELRQRAEKAEAERDACVAQSETDFTRMEGVADQWKNAAAAAEARAAHNQSIIDRLMLEYCPHEMTPEQVENWGKHQVRASDGSKS